MFGHSMGSMIARLYATKYGEELDGLILCGTSEIFPEMENIVSELKAEIDAKRRTSGPRLSKSNV